GATGMVEEMKQTDSQEEHVNELKAMCQLGRAAIPVDRGRCWQRRKRQQQARIRHRAVDFYHARQQQGTTLDAVARSLSLYPRTLRQWDYACRNPARQPALLGRPVVRSELGQRSAVIGFLQQHGSWTSVATLRQAFPTMARAELANLAWRYRRVLHRRYHD